jgi:hypothetical protein
MVIPINMVIMISENLIKSKAFPPIKYARITASGVTPMLGIVHDPRAHTAPVTAVEPVVATTLNTPPTAPPNLTVRCLTAILNCR